MKRPARISRAGRAHDATETIAKAATGVVPGSTPGGSVAVAPPAATPGDRVGLAAPAAAFALVVALALALFLISVPSVALAGDPPCSSLYPSAGPGGIDLKGACVANEVVQGYVSPNSTSDMLWAAGLILAGSWMAAVVVYAAWRWLARKEGRRLAPTAPVAFWLCEACHSFNPDDATRCYRCHRGRPADPPTVDATVAPSWDQRFGRPPDL